jgi:hypothetical protein
MPMRFLCAWAAALLATCLIACESSSTTSPPSPSPGQQPGQGPCNRVADEDLTVTNLVGVSGPLHVTKDCNVVILQGHHCRIDPKQLDPTNGYPIYPWVIREVIGFDAGLNHYDVILKGALWDSPGTAITVPGTQTQVGNVRHGATVEVDMYVGRQGGPDQGGWAATSGTITFNPEGDGKHPVGGGKVDVELTDPSGKLPKVHMYGKWYAEQPCGPSTT